MTGTYESNPMPHVVSVRCPSCAAHARFEFAEVARISRKSDVPFFQKSRLFDYQLFEGRWHGQAWHGAIFYAGLHGTGTRVLRNLPEGYAPSDWDHSRYLVRGHGTDRGALVCHACGLRRRHVLQWPAEAWFQIEYRRQVLWAFDRSSAIALLDHIRSADRRKRRQGPWSSMLLHVPGAFLEASARELIVKRLERVLRDG